MKRFLIAVAAVAALLILPQRPAVTRAPPSSQPSAQLPTGPRTVHQSAMDPTMPSGPIDAVQIVLDFAPGAWTPPHWHGGPLLVTVVDRQLAMRQHGTERTFKKGDLWIEYPGIVHAAGNKTNDTSTVVVSFLMPRGGRLTSIVQ